jgi:hypothetical protein
MSGMHRNSAIAVTAMIAAALGTAAASGNPATVPAPAQPGADAGAFRCEIQAKPGGGSTSLAAVVHARAAVNGSYTFKVVSSSRGGNSNINQGGPFAAAANGTVTLGTVSVGPGAAYDATLTVIADGATATCIDPVKRPL